jgi:hypothetical protein
MMRAQFFLCTAAVSPLLLTACSTTAWSGLETLAQAFWGDSADIEHQPLDPKLTYLRVQVGQQVGLMVQANDIAAAQADHSRWYSVDGVVLRLMQGRIQAVNEGGRSWTAVEPNRVDWRAVASGQVQRWREVSDQRPGYRFGLARDRELRVARATPPAHVLEASRHVTAPVTWFEERNAQGQPQSAWYAVDVAQQPARVIYGQTCLQAQWCVNWQVWPPNAASAAEASARTSQR